MRSLTKVVKIFLAPGPDAPAADHRAGRCRKITSGHQIGAGPPGMVGKRLVGGRGSSAPPGRMAHRPGLCPPHRRSCANCPSFSLRTCRGRFWNWPAYAMAGIAFFQPDPQPCCRLRWLHKQIGSGLADILSWGNKEWRRKPLALSATITGVSPRSAMATGGLQDIRKPFGASDVLKRVGLQGADGVFLSLVSPSGRIVLDRPIRGEGTTRALAFIRCRPACGFCGAGWCWNSPGYVTARP